MLTAAGRWLGEARLALMAGGAVCGIYLVFRSVGVDVALPSVPWIADSSGPAVVEAQLPSKRASLGRPLAEAAEAIEAVRLRRLASGALRLPLFAFRVLEPPRRGLPAISISIPPIPDPPVPEPPIVQPTLPTVTPPPPPPVPPAPSKPSLSVPTLPELQPPALPEYQPPPLPELRQLGTPSLPAPPELPAITYP